MVFTVWNELNAALMATRDEATCREMLDEELALPAPRKIFALRIHSRLNKLRATRERAEILKKVG